MIPSFKIMRKTIEKIKILVAISFLTSCFMMILMQGKRYLTLAKEYHMHWHPMTLESVVQNHVINLSKTIKVDNISHKTKYLQVV